MKRMREHAVFTWQHAIFLSNLRSWNAHIEQFITDTEKTKYYDVMCFAVTYTRSSNFTEISNHLDSLKVIYFCTERGFAFCFKEHSVEDLEENMWQQQ